MWLLQNIKNIGDNLKKTTEDVSNSSGQKVSKFLKENSLIQLPLKKSNEEEISNKGYKKTTEDEIKSLNTEFQKSICDYKNYLENFLESQTKFDRNFFGEIIQCYGKIELDILIDGINIKGEEKYIELKK